MLGRRRRWRLERLKAEGEAEGEGEFEAPWRNRVSRMSGQIESKQTATRSQKHMSVVPPLSSCLIDNDVGLVFLTHSFLSIGSVYEVKMINSSQSSVGRPVPMNICFYQVNSCPEPSLHLSMPRRGASQLSVKAALFKDISQWPIIDTPVLQYSSHPGGRYYLCRPI